MRLQAPRGASADATRLPLPLQPPPQEALSWKLRNGQRGAPPAPQRSRCASRHQRHMHGGTLHPCITARSSLSGGRPAAYRSPHADALEDPVHGTDK